MPFDQIHRAGGSIEDFCRVCKTDRIHTIIALDAEGRPARVDCGYCHSEHNYRGGPRMVASSSSSSGSSPSGRARKEPFPIVSDRERIGPVMSSTPSADSDLELLLRRIIREEAGITPAVPAEKW